MHRHLLATLCLFLLSQPALSAPRVVASIAPLHALTAAVMRGVAEPTLLLGSQTSPHDASLRPSQARALSQADLLVWIGPQLESFLARPVLHLVERRANLQLTEVEGMNLLKQRGGGAWDAEHDEDALGHGHDQHDLDINPHLWLSPQNARRIVRAVAARLQQIDPLNAKLYADNLQKLEVQISRTEARLSQQLAPFKAKPYLVFHDAYHYFESAFGLNAIGSIRVSPDRPPGARRLLQLREKIAESKAVCLFIEPQLSQATAHKLTINSKIRLGLLDPLGTRQTPAEKGWFTLMTDLGNNLASCLSGASP